jgi:hypothetical protein
MQATPFARGPVWTVAIRRTGTHPPIDDWKLLELTQDKQQESQCAFPIWAGSRARI